MTNNTPYQRILPLCILTIVFSLLYLHSSEITGSLAVDLQYDDVVYANDAASRLRIISEQSLGKFLLGLWQDPPHSPFSTGLAMLAFSLGGISEFALYAANTLILLVLAYFLAEELNSSRRATVISSLLFLLISPLAFRTMRDFRPDIALGLATAMMVLWYINGLIDGNKAALTKAACMFGIALLIKPTFFAHTVAIALALVGFSMGNHLLRHLRLPAAPGVSFARMFLFLGVGALIALPYFAVHGAQIVDYFYSNTRGQHAAVWSIPEGNSIFSTMGIIFDYAFSLAGAHIYAALFVMLASIFVLAWKRDFAPISKVCLQVVISALSFAILVFGRHRNEYFLASCAWIFLLTGVVAYAALDRHFGLRTRRLIVGLFAISGLLAMFVNSAVMIRRNDPEGLRTNSANEFIVRTILDDYATSHSSDGQPTIFVPFAGMVNSDALRWITLRDNRKANFNAGFMSADLDAAKASSIAADYVVLPNDLVSGYSRYLPSSSVLSALSEWVFTNPDFYPVSKLDTNLGYFIFRNRSIANSADRSIQVQGGIATLEGFNNEEGPYPHWNLPLVRWMNKQDARACVLGKPSARYHVKLRMRADMNGTLEVRNLQNVLLGSRKLLAEDFLVDMAFDTANVEPRSCLRFFFVPEQKSDSNKLVLFSRIDIRQQD